MSSPLSAFTAIPNPQMPAFLGAQSFIMMYQAGEGWQYGKRRISALSNEEFNKITPQSLMERQAMELKGAIPVMERSMNNMTAMIPMIIEQYGDFIREAIKAMPQALTNIQPGATISEGMNQFYADFISQRDSAGKKFVGQFGQSQMLAYAKFILQQEVNRNKAKQDVFGGKGKMIPEPKVYPSGWELAKSKQEAIDMAARTKIKLQHREGSQIEIAMKSGKAYPIVVKSQRIISGRKKIISITHMRSFNEHKLYVLNLRKRVARQPNLRELITAYSTAHRKKTGVWL